MSDTATKLTCLACDGEIGGRPVRKEGRLFCSYPHRDEWFQQEQARKLAEKEAERAARRQALGMHALDTEGDDLSSVTPGPLYFVEDGWLCVQVWTQDGPKARQLSNTTGRVLVNFEEERQAKEEGDEQGDSSPFESSVSKVTAYLVELGLLSEPDKVHQEIVEADVFHGDPLRLVSDILGAEGRIIGGRSGRDSFMDALRSMTRSPARVPVYRRTGYVFAPDGQAYFVDARGAHGVDGLVDQGIVFSCLPEDLARYEMPDRPADLRPASAATYKFLNLGPPGRPLYKVTVPLYLATIVAGIFERSPRVGETLIARTGAGKTTLASLVLGFHGPRFTEDTLPTSLRSTGNRNIELAAICHNVILPIDDIPPSGANPEARRDKQQAERAARIITNAEARGILSRDRKLLPARRAQAFPIFTGEEELGSQESDEARNLRIPFTREELGLRRLDPETLKKVSGPASEAVSEVQRLSAAGHLAEMTSDRVSFLLEDLRGAFAWVAEDFERLRRLAPGEHEQTPGHIAKLAVAAEIHLSHLVHRGVITEDQAAAEWPLWWSTLCELAEIQTSPFAKDAGNRFVNLLGDLLASKRIHFTDRGSGLVPSKDPEAWGWTLTDTTSETMPHVWRSGGTRVGGVDEETGLVHLFTGQALVVAMKYGAELGEPIGGTKNAVLEGLWAVGMLNKRDGRHFEVKRTGAGYPLRVLELSAGAIGLLKAPSEKVIPSEEISYLSVSPGDCGYVGSKPFEAPITPPELHLYRKVTRPEPQRDKTAENGKSATEQEIGSATHIPTISGTDRSSRENANENETLEAFESNADELSEVPGSEADADRLEWLDRQIDAADSELPPAPTPQELRAIAKGTVDKELREALLARADVQEDLEDPSAPHADARDWPELTRHAQETDDPSIWAWYHDDRKFDQLEHRTARMLNEARRRVPMPEIEAAEIMTAEAPSVPAEPSEVPSAATRRPATAPPATARLAGSSVKSGRKSHDEGPRSRVLDAEGGTLALLTPGNPAASAEKVHDLGELLSVALEVRADPLTLTAQAMAALGIAGKELDESDPFAAAPGWDVRFEHGSRARVFGLLGPAGTPGRPEARVIWAPADSAHFGKLASGPSILAALERFETAHGIPWQGSGGATFAKLLRKSHNSPAGRKLVERLGTETFEPEMVTQPGTFGEAHAFAWDRAPQGHECKATHAHSYDRNGDFLSALGETRWPIGAPEHLTQLGPFDPEVISPGWWCVTAPELESWPALPYLLTSDGMAPTPGHSLWITTTTARFVAREFGIQLEVVHAWVWPEHVAYGRSAARKLSEARADLVQGSSAETRVAYGAHKAVYSEGINNLRAQYHRDNLTTTQGLVHGPRSWCPTLHAHIVAGARASRVRSVRKAALTSGIWPVAMAGTDQVTYLTNDPDPVSFAESAGLMLGSELGKWKHAATLRVPDSLATLDYQPGRLLALLETLTQRGDNDNAR